MTRARPLRARVARPPSLLQLLRMPAGDALAEYRVHREYVVDRMRRPRGARFSNVAARVVATFETRRAVCAEAEAILGAVQANRRSLDEMVRDAEYGRLS